MKRLLSIALLLAPTVALAMQQGDAPPKFLVPWANSAGSSYVRSIPTPSQVGVQNCAASLTDGFPPLTFVPASAGGCPPFGQDFNGILKQLSQAARWGQAGGPFFYDSGFATAIGGYPNGAILASAVVPGNQWMSTANDNMTDPDDFGANWVQAPGQVPTGTPMPSLIGVPAGYVTANGLTIGDASSNATGRASGDTKFLFVQTWSWCTNVAQCPIFTSGGAPTTRGATALVDYAAHKALTLPNMKGLGLMGVDVMGGSASTFLSGVPVTTGSSIFPGSILGENFHPLSAAENGGHTHANTLSDPGHAHAVPVTDPGHAHANALTDPGHTHAVPVTDPGHAHANALTDPGHAHAVPVTDPGHTHANSGITRAQFPISSGGTGPFLYGASIGGGAGALIDVSATGITASASSSTTGVTISNASSTTGVTASASSHATGVTISNASSATGITAGASPSTTGVTISNASSGSGTGHNTVDRVMLVIWNLKL